MSITNFQGLERLVTDTNKEGWDANWIRKDKEFKLYLNSHPEL